MFKLDNELIKDKFQATSYSFYTDEEIEKISVKQIINSTAFDHLGNPMDKGIYDKALGVSPFDRRSTCVTCGLDSTYCPGHVGHIELTAPIYNPFLVNHLYKLLKSKCFSCHRIRINPKKIDAYVMSLKLIKSGQIVKSTLLKNYFLNAAKEVQLVSDSQLADSKKLTQLKKFMDSIVTAKGKKQNIDDKETEQTTNNPKDMATYFSRLSKRFSKLKAIEEENILRMFEEATEKSPFTDEDLLNSEIDNTDNGPTTVIQKCLKEIMHEIWAQVVSIVCPHCNYKTPGLRKDGYTKIFIKPLSDKMKNSMKQQERLSGKASNSMIANDFVLSEGGTRDDGFEVETGLSASGINSSRRHSHVGGDEYSQTGTNLDDENDEEDDDMEGDEDNNPEMGSRQKLMSPMEAKDHIERLWAKEKELLDIIYGRYYRSSPQEDYKSDSLGPSMFFMTKLLVPPNRFRPESQGAFGGAGGATSGDRSFLHAHSAMITKILVANLALKDALLSQNGAETHTQHEKQGNNDVFTKWIQLQDSVNTFVDSSMAQKTADKEQQGLRQLLEKKEGMFRMKMMGKRVNYGGRSVISPDPYITTDQIGVPVFMAQKLTFPESFSQVNQEKLRRMVINGAHHHPGANIVEDEETGLRTNLDTLGHQQRKGIASLLGIGRKIVYRHLQTGDVLLVNRQPTLHKPSIMAHVARVLPKEQTIRMHYANCSTYNADFDGDEMNLHFPQSYQGCSEAYKLMATHKQYIVPTSGKPIRGLIQDSVIAGVFMSSKDTFFTKDQYQQLVYIGLRELIEDNKLGKIFTLQPAMIRPAVRWTGKQVISTILKNIVNQEQKYNDHNLTGLNLDSKSKLPAKEWGPIGIEEGDVVIRDNELLQGTLDKNQFGSSEFGMVHAFYEIYGSEKAGELLTSLARIFTMFLQTHGFTCGLDDLVLTPEFNKQRRLLIEQGHKEGVEAAADFCGLKNYKASAYNYSNRIVFPSDASMKDKEINKFNNMALPPDPFEGKKVIQLEDPIRTRLEEKMNTTEDIDKLDVEFDSKVKSKMNLATSAVTKLCIPDGLVKRFPKNNMSAMCLSGAKGGIVNMTQICCMLGQQELEGRRVPKMQNGKTLPCNLPFDPNPRSSGYVTDRFISGLRPQDFFFHCMAGREGLIDTAVKTSRSGYLQRCLIKQLESLVVNYDLTVRDNDGAIVQFLYGEDGIDVMNTKYLEKFNFLEKNFTSFISDSNGKDILKRVDNSNVDDYKKQVKRNMKILHKERPTLRKQQLKAMSSDPLLAKFHPLKFFGSISEKMEEKLEHYLKNDSQLKILEQQSEQSKYAAVKMKYQAIQPETFMKSYYLKYMRSVVNPGENVGTIAAQSVGEPSTQMTLNTFHLAGHGAGNMTLGVPRLKEILMTQPTHIKTPSMNVYFRKDCEYDMTEMEAFANKFRRLKMSDVTKEVTVTQYITQEEGGQFFRIYNVTLEFEETSKLKKQLGIKFVDLIEKFSDQFVPLLLNETLKELKKAASADHGVGGVNSVFQNDIDTKTIASRSAPPRNAGKTSKKQAKSDKGDMDDIDNEQLEQDQEYLRMTSSSKKSKDDEGDDDDDDDDDELPVDDGDYNPEIDGMRKKVKDVMGNQQEDEEDKDIKRREHMQDSVAHQNNEDHIKGEEQQETEEQKISRLCNILREKFSKYLGYIRSIQHKDEKQITLQIAFPLEFKKVLMLTLAENTLSKVLLRSINGIERCVLVPPQKESDKPYLVVQGINFDAFYHYQHIVDVNKMETNDIWYMVKKYGIEAGRANLVREVRSVFAMYGIEVDYRHLSLIGDFITFNGDYRAFNRIGMEESCSPFLKMSFETTMKYLVSSCINKDTDDLSTPASSLVMGQVPRVGTGIFDVMHDNDAAILGY